MNIWWYIFVSCLVVDTLVPGVNLSGGWYCLWLFLALITD